MDFLLAHTRLVLHKNLTMVRRLVQVKVSVLANHTTLLRIQ